MAEALILGLPVVTTDCSGMSELLRNGECGIITDNNEEALYEGMKQVLNTPDMLKFYTEKAKDRSGDFSIDRLIEPFENLLV